jgi:hypothetical protein
MPIDKFHLYAAAATRHIGLRRSMEVVDTMCAIGFAFDHKGLDEHLLTLQGIADG